MCIQIAQHNFWKSRVVFDDAQDIVVGNALAMHLHCIELNAFLKYFRRVCSAGTDCASANVLPVRAHAGEHEGFSIDHIGREYDNVVEVLTLRGRVVRYDDIAFLDAFIAEFP